MRRAASMLERVRQARGRYPAQFWLLFWGLLLSSIGGSLVWPFLTIFLRQRLGISFTQVGILLSVNAGAGLAGVALAGPAADRFGRRGVMVVSLIAQAASMLAMTRATTLGAWFGVMALLGAFNPLYRVGADAMIADLVPARGRAEAYALLRMISNLGIALGPALGGFLTSISYNIAFLGSAGASGAYALLLIVRARETLPAGAAERTVSDRGYGPVLRDRAFLAFVGVYALASMAYIILMVLMPVYAKENYGVVEQQYGFILATNALMVVVFQYAVTRRTATRPATAVLGVGALFYAAAVAAVGVSTGFLGFWLAMVVLTVGELIVVPTSTTLTANMAPDDQRGRYMGVYSLTFGVAIGLGPILGGLLHDQVSPQATWYGAAALGLAAAVGFAALGRAARLRGDPSPSAA